jgi:hypothetical protein
MYACKTGRTVRVTTGNQSAVAQAIFQSMQKMTQKTAVELGFSQKLTQHMVHQYGFKCCIQTESCNIL